MGVIGWCLEMGNEGVLNVCMQLCIWSFLGHGKGIENNRGLFVTRLEKGRDTNSKLSKALKHTAYKKLMAET